MFFVLFFFFQEEMTIEWTARSSWPSMLILNKSFIHEIIFRGFYGIFVYAIFEKCQGIYISDIRTEFVPGSAARR